MEHDIAGNLVSTVRRAYGAFTDRATGEQRPGGVTLWLWLSIGRNDAPVEVRVPDQEQFELLGALPAGCPVVATCEIRANNNRVSYRLLAFDAEAKPAATKAA